MNRIRNVREDRDLDQKTVAELLGISQQYYSRYELGQIELPIRHYIKLARFYGLSIDYLAGLSDDPAPRGAEAALTPKQMKLLAAYQRHEALQGAVDKLLDI